MKILSSKLMHEFDRVIMECDGITSYQLMERAAQNIAQRIMQRFPDASRRFVVFSGCGNNGGDGLAVGRILYTHGYSVECYLLESEKYSEDCSLNAEKVNRMSILHTISNVEDLPKIYSGGIVIDALFGSGLNREIVGVAYSVVRAINYSGAFVISIDIPSGLGDDSIARGVDDSNMVDDAVGIVKADWTLTIESPSLSLLMPENGDYVGDFEIVPLATDNSCALYLDSPYFYTELDFVQSKLRRRKKFSHKGTYGHTLLVTGSKGKAGAAVLCSRACHRAGSGLVTACVPSSLVDILQISTPETMVVPSADEDVIAGVPSIEKYSAIGIGPGIGTDDRTAEALKMLLTTATQPLVLDADALNILAAHPDMMAMLPKNTILTPHPKEFERMFGRAENSVERLSLLAAKAKELGVVIVLKGAHTAVADRFGYVDFNSTGNPGMATAGSGDVLTGIVAALLSQKYAPKEAAVLGVYIHGLAGDIVAERLGVQGVIASDMVGALPLAVKKIAES